MDNAYRKPNELVSAQIIDHIQNSIEESAFFTNAHFLVDFGPWNAGEYVRYLAVDYHSKSIRQITNAGLCVRSCPIEVSHGMIRPAAPAKTSSFCSEVLRDALAATDEIKPQLHIDYDEPVCTCKGDKHDTDCAYWRWKVAQEDTDTLSEDEEKDLSPLTLEQLHQEIKKTCEEMNQNILDLLTRVEPLRLPPNADGAYIPCIEENLKPGTLLEGMKPTGPRDAVICARFPASIDDKSQMIYVVRTFVFGNLLRLTVKEIQELFRVTKNIHATELIPAWSLISIGPATQMEYKWP